MIPQLLEVFMIIGRNRHAEGRHLMESAIFRLVTYVLNKIWLSVSAGELDCVVEHLQVPLVVCCASSLL